MKSHMQTLQKDKNVNWEVMQDALKYVSLQHKPFWFNISKTEKKRQSAQLF